MANEQKIVWVSVMWNEKLEAAGVNVKVTKTKRKMEKLWLNVVKRNMRKTSVYLRMFF